GLHARRDVPPVAAEHLHRQAHAPDAAGRPRAREGARRDPLSPSPCVRSGPLVSSVDISTVDGEPMGEPQAPAADLVDERSSVTTAAFLATVRDIARGGLAGLIV